MTGCEQIKEKRVERGWSVKVFAKMAGIHFNSVKAYESGDMKIGSIPVFRLEVIFNLLDISVTDFFDEYCPYKDDMDKRIRQWDEQHVDYSYDNVNKRISDRIDQITCRGRLGKSEIGEIHRIYSEYFTGYRDKGYVIPKDEYDAYVIPILYRIRSYMDKVPKNPIGEKVVDALHRSNYNLIDISNLCGVSRQHLGMYINDKYDFRQMRTETALKLCYLLKIDFYDTFCIVEKTI